MYLPPPLPIFIFGSNLFKISNLCSVIGLFDFAGIVIICCLVQFGYKTEFINCVGIVSADTASSDDRIIYSLSFNDSFLYAGLTSIAFLDPSDNKRANNAPCE